MGDKISGAFGLLVFALLLLAALSVVLRWTIQALGMGEVACARGWHLWRSFLLDYRVGFISRTSTYLAANGRRVEECRSCKLVNPPEGIAVLEAYRAGRVEVKKSSLFSRAEVTLKGPTSPPQDSYPLRSENHPGRTSARPGHERDEDEDIDREIQEAIKTYREVQADEGATGNPLDYSQKLAWIPPAPDAPAAPRGALCGCCAVAFDTDSQSIGLFVSGGVKDWRPVVICACCVLSINELYRQHGRGAGHRVPDSYDPLGQRVWSMHPGETPTKLGLARVIMIRLAKKRVVRV